MQGWVSGALRASTCSSVAGAGARGELFELKSSVVSEQIGRHLAVPVGSELFPSALWACRLSRQVSAELPISNPSLKRTAPSRALQLGSSICVWLRRRRLALR